jgi:hypothetical protein
LTGGSVTLTDDFLESNSAIGGNGITGGSGFGGIMYADAGATVTLCSDTVEFNKATWGGVGYPYGHGAGGGLYIAPKTTVYLDPITVTNTINNTDSSGTNGKTANIDGAYVLQNC